MKKTILLVCGVLALFTACNDDEGSSDNTPLEADYYPLSSSLYWTYDVTSTNAAAQGRDSLYIKGDTLINSLTYKKFKTGATPIGFFSGSLNNNSLRKDNGKLLLTGSAGIDLGATFPIDINVTDFVVFDQNAASGATLSTLPGTVTQDLNGFPLTFNYTLKTTAMQTLPTFTSPNGKIYTDVKSVKTTLNLTITTEFSGFPVTVMNPQDVVTSTQYYANSTGVVYANTVISYQLQDFSSLGITLPFPQSDTQTQEEFLDDYIFLLAD